MFGTCFLIKLCLNCILISNSDKIQTHIQGHVILATVQQASPELHVFWHVHHHFNKSLKENFISLSMVCFIFSVFHYEVFKILEYNKSFDRSLYHKMLVILEEWGIVHENGVCLWSTMSPQISSRVTWSSSSLQRWSTLILYESDDLRYLTPKINSDHTDQSQRQGLLTGRPKTTFDQGNMLNIANVDPETKFISVL